MIKVLYFAGLRETLGVSGEEVTPPATALDVGALRAHLAGRGGEWGKLLTTKNLRFAVNQDMARADTPVRDGDEVAFFPPVTGG
ncbi:MAG TPA: molybdopterin converting factor subunit 1 [Azospira sp.]|nr:molybdopterin converting factor subunit 1 [Azospira sp.]